VQTDKPLLPMIPEQMLVIRNVSISTKEWGSDREVLNTMYGQYSGEQQSSSSETAGNEGACFGFVCFGGSESHAESHASEQSQWGTSKTATAHFGTTFDGETLQIRGAQIVAFLCDIVPASPPLDDPGLAAQASAAKPAPADAAKPAPATQSPAATGAP